MSEHIVLNARTRNKKGRRAMTRIRKSLCLPAVVYGYQIKPRALELNLNTFEKIFRQAGENTLIDLQVDNESPVKVLIHDVQLHPLKNFFTHADFYKVRMDKKIKAEVPVIFSGEAPAVKELGGIFVKNYTALQVECLPGDLPHNITVEISGLKSFEDQIRVGDIVLPAKVIVLENADETVALVTPPRSEEELKALEEAVVEDVEKVEAIAKEKTEEAEEASGEVKAASEEDKKQAKE